MRTKKILTQGFSNCKSESMSRFASTVGYRRTRDYIGILWAHQAPQHRAKDRFATDELLFLETAQGLLHRVERTCSTVLDSRKLLPSSL